MRCSLRIKRSAAKALAAIPKADRLRVVEAIDLLCDTPAAGPALKVELEAIGAQRAGAPGTQGCSNRQPYLIGGGDGPKQP